MNRNWRGPSQIDLSHLTREPNGDPPILPEFFQQQHKERLLEFPQFLGDGHRDAHFLLTTAELHLQRIRTVHIAAWQGERE